MLNQPRRHRRESNPEEFDSRTEKSGIQWPTAQELQRVSTSLAKINRSGMRQERAGDYFKSGDLAFQLQEIIRTTAALLKKSQRDRAEPTSG